MVDIMNNIDTKNSESVLEKEQHSNLNNKSSQRESAVTAVEADSDKSESDEPSSPQNDTPTTGTKRARKTVQRLSETWNKAFAAKEEARAKHVKVANAEFEAGKGLALGSVEAIENNIRKAKPQDLKPLHQMIYGRPGTPIEIRSNLRKFHGFGFSKDSQPCEKKINSIQQRSTSELRETLKILQLEVNGNREAMANRLVDFLLKPTLSVLKNSGNLPKKMKQKKNKARAKPNTTKSKPKAKGSVSSGVSATVPSPSDDESSLSSEEEDDEQTTPSPKQRKTSHPSRSGPPKKTKNQRVSLNEFLAEKDASISPKHSHSSLGEESDEDVPLASLKAQNIPTKPSDEELKGSIVTLLKTVNLEETSLKVVRQKIFDRYPNVDLTDKKDFINTTVKEYLSQS